MVADLALVPCKPSPMDLWALQDTLDIIEQAQGLRPELEVRIVFNQVQRSSTLSREVGQVLDDLSLSRMETSLPYRAELMRTLASGQGVTVSKPSHNASYEVRRWVDEVQEILGSDGHPWGMQ